MAWLTNKYAEGYPGHRYYGGCEVVDMSEQLAIDRLKQLFGAEYANVQPHSGAQANAAVFLAVLNPGDKFLGLNLAHGGHLSHGSLVNSSGILYQPLAYNVKEDTGRVDYDQMEEVALKERPKLIVGGASAYSRDWDYARMLCRFGLNLSRYFGKYFGMFVFETEIFEFAFDGEESEAIGKRSVNVERFACDFILFGGRHRTQRSHIVKTVGNFNQDHANVFRHARERELHRILILQLQTIKSVLICRCSDRLSFHRYGYKLYRTFICVVHIAKQARFMLTIKCVCRI